jgi:parallel beta-helix repeat protein
MQMGWVVLAVGCVLVAATGARAATTHVYATGPLAPTNLQAAIDVAQTGDTLILHGDFPWNDGHVDGSFRKLEILSKTNLTLVADATDGASHGGNYRNAIYLSGCSNITLAGITFSLNNAHGINIANNNTGMQVVTNCTLLAGAGTGSGQAGLYALSPVTVVNCRVDVTTSHNGIDVRGVAGNGQYADNCLIQNNTITNCATGIMLWGDSCQAIGNTIFACTGGGISAGNYNNNCIVRSNTVYRCGTGMGNGVATGTEYSYNVIYSNTTYGISIDPDNNASGRSGYKVHHNTVFGNGTGIRIADVSSVGNNQVAANIVVGNGTGINLTNMTTVAAIVYSDLWNNTTDYTNQAVTATKTGVVTSDPGFHSTDPADKRFLQLGPATPAAVLTTGSSSLFVGAAYMGAIAPYFPAGTVISIK